MSTTIRGSGYGASSLGWWVAFLGAIGAVLILIFWCPEPCLQLLEVLPNGLLVTFEITVGAFSLAVLLGLAVGLASISRRRVIPVIATTYVEAVRGIPVLVQLLVIFYALERFGQLPPLAAAIIALAFCHGAYLGEVARISLETVDPGPSEAARALGFNSSQTMIHVILPQAWRNSLVPAGSQGIALLKDTSLVSILAIADLLGRGREFAAEGFAVLETYILVALLYLLITLILSRLLRVLEARVSRSVRS